MYIKPLTWTSAVMLSFCALTPAQAETGNADKGKQMAAVCVACHQQDGAGKENPGTESWPRLAGLDAGYIQKQLTDFKSGARNNATMKPFASMLNTQQAANVAAYYASLPAPAIKATAPTDAQQTLGKKLAKRGDWDRYIPACNSCHGPDALGVGSSFPALSGQHAGYIAQQLKAWREGKRNNDPQDLMLAVASRMSDDDIAAVSAWLANQPAAK